MLARRAIAEIASESLDTICILTSGRPAILARALMQCVASLDTNARQARIIVFDDSQDVRTQEENRNVCNESSGKGDAANICYLGSNYRRTLRDTLVACGIDSRTVDFGLFGMSHTSRRTGSSRNALMLATIGTRILSIDDDMEFSFAHAPDPQPGVFHTDQYDPCEYWSYPSRHDLLKANPLHQQDILQLHSQLLGADLDATTCSGRVLYTLTGIAGDCGMATPRCFWLSGASRDRMVQSARAYETAVTSREVLKISRATTISSGRFCMTGCIGLDNRNGLPPFFPLGRNTDGIFGSIIKAVEPTSLSAHVPYAMLHTPPAGAKQFGREALWQNTSHHDLARVVTACLGQFKSNQALSLSGLGQAFIDFAATDECTFATRLKNALSEYVERSLAYIQTLHKMADGPENWRRDLAKFTKCFQDSVSTTTVSFRDVPMTAGHKSEYAAVKDYLSLFGQLLVAWTEMTRIAAGSR